MKQKKIIRLRPHHLLCIQTFQGKGYNPEFVENLQEIVTKCNQLDEVYIEIVNELDDICQKCCCVQGDCCNQDEKVRYMDNKVKQHFHLKNQIYCYRSLIEMINKQINDLIIEDICKECSWYKSANCHQILLAKKRK